ncbi:Coagulation factor 5/8 type domain-containing protein [Actinomadura sp. 21ATH]|uniref:Coagulation factor 5/8 type domain-containing protein n=1 Tax=Actinomadura sp. 21ATH TaxID=1735444 RepID=UPI0035C09EA7
MSRRPLRRSASVSLIAALLGACLLPPAAQAEPAPAPVPAPAGEVRGYIDAHSHLMSYEAFGGMLMCGRPFAEGGAPEALRDCPDHAGNGALAWFENLLKNGSPLGLHDPVGWPTFRDWPAWNSRTHQQAYHAWLERSWRGGQRVLVNHLVANRQICEFYPLKRTGCDEMDSIRLQARRMNEMQDYIDRLNGGPGKGWFRIVTGSEEARRVIEAGRLAVVLGVETSEPFGCRKSGDTARCTREQIDRGLDEMRELGVSSMFLCHKFDNALCGVRFDGDAAGAVINLGNFLGTGRFWQVERCAGREHDNAIQPAGGLGDLLRGPLSGLGRAGITVPLYPSPPHCNVHGLTALGEHMLRGMIDRNMIVEIDHMSVKAAGQTLDLLERERYSGVVSSHSWTDGNYARRIYALGGMITGYGHAADGFVAEWRRNKAFRDPRFAFGYGYGLDANGMGPLPPPRANNAGNGVRYPFTSPIDPAVTLDRQRTGLRTWDVNTDGVANYGLVPDWIADMRTVGGPEIIDDLARGAEAYLQMWRRTETAAPPRP